MKYLKQVGIILSVSCAGEILRYFLPFPIPSTVYGLIIMLFLLQTKLLKVSQVKEASQFLLDIMTVLFIPATVALMTMWDEIQGILIPVIVISIVSTLLVFLVTGKLTDHIIMKKGEHHE